MEKKLALITLKRIKEQLASTHYGPDVITYRRDAQFIIEDLFGKNDDHYLTLSSAGRLSSEIEREVALVLYNTSFKSHNML
jgi:hypothetical protein